MSEVLLLKQQPKLKTIYIAFTTNGNKQNRKQRKKSFISYAPLSVCRGLNVASAIRHIVYLIGFHGNNNNL